MDSARHDLEFREGQPLLGALRPVFSPNAQVAPHRFRGRTWYVAQDPVSLQYFRFGPAEHRVVALLDGAHTLASIHQELKRALGAEAPSFQAIVAFVQMLRSANLLHVPEGEPLEALCRRVDKKRSQRTRGVLANFLFLTIPLVDPDRFLARTVRYVRFLYSRWFLALWLAVVLAGLGLFFASLRSLAAPAQGILARENLLLLWASFVGLKIVHEFSHAYLAKHYGAEVHRMGILFLVLTPTAYVDVTGLWAVEGKERRALVGAAGLMAELFVACGALALWLVIEPGTLRSLAYNVLFVASVSAVLFNGNPLLRFDAYYILSDWIELPNLWQNCRRYLHYLGKRYLLGLDEEPVTDDPRERAWLVGYGLASLCYRTVIVVGIILFISSKFFGLGVVLGAAAGFVWLVLPAGKLVHFLLLARATRRRRLRCIGVSAVLAAAVVAPLAMLRVPQHVGAPCVLTEQRRAMVRARWAGFVERVCVRDGEWVEAGRLIAVCRNEDLPYDEVRATQALAAARVRLAQYEKAEDIPAAQNERFRIQLLEETLEVLRQRVASLRLVAPCDGRVIAPGLPSAPGRFLASGDPVALIAQGPFSRVVALVAQADIADVQRAAGREVAVRFRSHPGETIRCRIVQVLPKATHDVPHPGITDAGGGPVLLDPGAADGRRTLLPWFRVELELPEGAPSIPLGATGEARFEIARRPLLDQWVDRLRRLLQTRFFL